MNHLDAVQEYQCPGCVLGPYPDCYKTNDNLACDNHIAGTITSGVGQLFLGLPKGFCRVGNCKLTKIYIFTDLKSAWGYDKFNVPVWKYFDSHKNTIVRGLSPRLNSPWIHIFLGDYQKDIDCYEITDSDINEMD